jgi:chemosensory pili system protein ChpA (sensor histidine kinase/response regulator)
MTLFKVLVVEDEVALRVIYDRILRLLGCEVTLAKDGEEALRLLDTTTPDLMFLDMLLPYVNGVQIIQHMSGIERLRHIHVVMVSSASEYEQYKKLLPVAEFHLKPILANQIKAIARRAMDATNHD